MVNGERHLHLFEHMLTDTTYVLFLIITDNLQFYVNVMPNCRLIEFISSLKQNIVESSLQGFIFL